jgi:glycerol dehydrogenase
MSFPSPYLPQAIFAVEESEASTHHPCCVPRAMIAPSRYIQGKNVLDHIGRYLTLLPSQRAAVLITARGEQRQGARLLHSLRSAQNDPIFINFGGESSQAEVERVVACLQAATPVVDCIVAVGGGKCIDAGKSVAYRLGVPVVVCPSLASNDAPCSALSIMYTPKGVYSGVEFFPHSPSLVAVDTQIVAEAPVRYLVAGMGDAMATWYEARTCYQNPQARSVIGTRPTLAASALGELCAKTLYADGIAAKQAVQNQAVTEALERIIEANTLLSGIGFESGGLAVAHSVAQGFTVIPAIHDQYLHGEMVAMGLLTQLMLENSPAEARQVAEFFAQVGLPVHLGQLSLSPQSEAELAAVIAAALAFPFVTNEPFAVTAETLLEASLQAHHLGMEVAEAVGDSAYRDLQS